MKNTGLKYLILFQRDHMSERLTMSHRRLMRFLKKRPVKKMNKIVLVFLETFKRQVKSWSFLIMVLAPFLAIGLGLGKVSSDNAEDMVKDVTEIAVVATSKDLQKQFENQTNVTIRYESLDKAKKALNKDKIAGYVSVSLEKGRYEARYHGKGSIDETSKAGIMNVLSRLQSSQNIVAAQLNDDQLHKLQVQPNFVEIKNSASKQNQIDKKQQEKFANNCLHDFAICDVFYFDNLLNNDRTRNRFRKGDEDNGSFIFKHARKELFLWQNAWIDDGYCFAYLNLCNRRRSDIRFGSKTLGG